MLEQLNVPAVAPAAWVERLRARDDRFDRSLAEDVYARAEPDFIAAQKSRFAATMEAHRRRFGEGPCALLRAPGRLNAFLEYLDMCAGDHMSTTIDGDIPVAVSARDDDTVVAANTSALFPERQFSIRAEAKRFSEAPWGTGETAGLPDTWDYRTRVYPYYQRTKGDHLNYILSPFLRFAWDRPDAELAGVNMTFGPSTCPLRAGTSSSSAVVVLSALACLWRNGDRLPDLAPPWLGRFLGEAEWYVGTHGGANDHTTILCNRPHGILYNRHSRPEPESTPLPFLRGMRIVLANSLWEANKALGANYVFNLRKGWMDLGDDLLRAAIEDLAAWTGARRPGWVLARVKERFGWPLDAGTAPLLDELDWAGLKARYNRFGSLDETILGIPQAAIESLIGLLPREIDPERAGRILAKDRAALARDYTLPSAEDRVWRPRNAATFFNRENVAGRAIERLLLEADHAARGPAGVPSASPEYDRYRRQLGERIESIQATIRDDFQVSNDQLDFLLRIAKGGPGYIAGKLTGAGSGGCVCIFVREEEAAAMEAYLDRAYYREPSNFERYREELRRVPEEGPRREMERNLAEALASIPAQRRIVSFSAGAGAIAPPR